jgi:hypothetical protein
MYKRGGKDDLSVPLTSVGRRWFGHRYDSIMLADNPNSLRVARQVAEIASRRPGVYGALDNKVRLEWPEDGHRDRW